MNKYALSSSQLLTESTLIERLHENGLTFDYRRVGGELEPYIEGYVGDVHIWIYNDGEACVIGRGLDRVFERPDFDSISELRETFIESVLALFSGY